MSTLFNELGKLFKLETENKLTSEEKVKICSYFTKNDQETRASASLDILSIDDKIKYLRTFVNQDEKDENNVVENQENKGSPEDLYIFIDNSNFHIEATKTICQAEALGKNFQLFIDYGRLLRVIQKTRKLGCPPTIVGSRPPPLDSLWNRVRKDGFDVHVYDKVTVKANIKEKTEKMVDNAIGFHMDEVIFTKTPATIALVSGDCDYFRNIQGALERNWKVEIWAWHSGVSHLVKKPSLQTTFFPLGNHYKFFAWCYGCTERTEVLQLTDGDDIRNWDNDDVMNCYVTLNLFGWWHRYQQGILLLYFRNNEELQSAQHWLQQNHPNIRLEVRENDYLR